MKGIFDISGNSRYNDDIEKHYHFPSDYLPIAKSLIGDWILYRETRAAGGRMAYISVARVKRIDPDPADPSHYYARVDDYLELDAPVRYRDTDGRFAERVLREMARPADAGRTLRGQSIRFVDDVDFAAIVERGLADTLSPDNRLRLKLTPSDADYETLRLLDEPLSIRRIEQVLVNRRIRDANFRRHVIQAYDSTCAVTGLRLINGGGRAEVEAAHIRPVAKDGPDIVSNGLALSSTLHWMFDRGLITIGEEEKVLVSRQVNDPDSIKAMINASGLALLPSDRSDRPDPRFLSWHREYCFKH